VVSFVAPVMPTYTPGPAIRTYDCDKDAGLQSSAPSGNGGAQSTARAGKGYRTSGEQVLVEWNDTTVATMTAFIENQLAANVLTMQEAVSMGLFKIEYEFAGMDADAQKTVKIETVWCDNDWDEGNGTNMDNNFDWTTPRAATWTMAGDAWVLSGTTRVRDTASVVDWADPITGYSNQEFKHLIGTVNSVVFTGTLQQYSAVADNWNSAELDEAFWHDLFYNVQDEGDPDESHFNCIGIRQFSEDGYSDPAVNWRMWLRESGNAPHLRITILAVPGDAVVDGKVDVYDLAALANNYQTGTGKTWWEADFNGDGEVNVYDLAILANHYGFETLGAAGGGPVPEPATLGLLALGGLALIRRRRR